MKKILKPILIVGFILATISHSYAQLAPAEIQRQNGVFYKLSVLKSEAEGKLYTNSSNIQAIKAYAKAKQRLDAVINQFQYEMSRKAGLARKFNKVNNYYFGDTMPFSRSSNRALRRLKNGIDEYVTLCSTFLATTYAPADGVPFAEIPLADAFAALWTTYKDIHDMRTERAKTLSEMLNSVRLGTPGQIKEGMGDSKD